jgi:hypothetical protein
MRFSLSFPFVTSSSQFTSARASSAMSAAAARASAFMRVVCLGAGALGSVLSFAGGEFFENAASDALQLSKTGQVVLELGIHKLGILGPELDAKDHVAELDRVGKQRVFLEFFESGFGVVVIHNFLVR